MNTHAQEESTKKKKRTNNGKSVRPNLRWSRVVVKKKGEGDDECRLQALALHIGHI